MTDEPVSVPYTLEGPSASYSLDVDPLGIRARAADAITGALAYGAQNTNPPPTGHWLTPFWEMARVAAQEPVIAECVGVMKDDSEYGNVVHWLTEGGIDAVEPGDYLYIINAPVPPDGALTLYINPAPLRLPGEVA